MAWLTGYTTRKKLTTDHTKIDSDLTNFPMVMILNSGRHDFSKGNSDGFDTRMTKSDGETLEKYERERHDSGSSLAEYHWKGTSVSSASDNDWYFYYRTEDTDDGADPINVWDANFTMVHHLIGANKDALDDSTGNNNDVTAENGTPDYNQDAKIGKGVNFAAASSEYVSIPTATSLNPGTSNFTFECWFKSADAALYRVMFKKGTGANQYATRLDADGTLFSYWRTDANGQLYRWTGTGGYDDGTWHYFAATLVYATPVLTHYVDGISNNDAAQTQENPWTGNITPPEVAWIGGETENNQYFNGLLDEIRISKGIVRSAAWIKASYNSGNDSLLTYGSEETSVIEKSVSDSGAGVEIVGIKGAIPIAESGIGVEVLAIKNLLSVLDSGLGTDAVSKAIVYLKSVADSGIGTEAILVKLVKAVQDSGSGADIISAILAKLLLQDSGVGIEQLFLSKCIEVADIGAGTDLASILRTILIQELGIGIDRVKVPPFYQDKYPPGGDSYIDKYFKQGDIYHGKY